jgi:hypothetical protein
METITTLPHSLSNTTCSGRGHHGQCGWKRSSLQENDLSELVVPAEVASHYVILSSTLSESMWLSIVRALFPEAITWTYREQMEKIVDIKTQMLDQLVPFFNHKQYALFGYDLGAMRENILEALLPSREVQHFAADYFQFNILELNMTLRRCRLFAPLQLGERFITLFVVQSQLWGCLMSVDFKQHFRVNMERITSLFEESDHYEPCIKMK